MAVTKPYEFVGFGAMAVTKPYKFIGFGAMAVTKPYEFIVAVAVLSGRSWRGMCRVRGTRGRQILEARFALDAQSAYCKGADTETP